MMSVPFHYPRRFTAWVLEPGAAAAILFATARRNLLFYRIFGTLDRRSLPIEFLNASRPPGESGLARTPGHSYNPPDQPARANPVARTV
jgi:hypothetical protein